jgi:hypothetical protein
MTVVTLIPRRAEEEGEHKIDARAVNSFKAVSAISNGRR